MLLRHPTAKRFSFQKQLWIRESATNSCTVIPPHLKTTAPVTRGVSQHGARAPVDRHLLGPNNLGWSLTTKRDIYEDEVQTFPLMRSSGSQYHSVLTRLPGTRCRQYYAISSISSAASRHRTDYGTNCNRQCYLLNGGGPPNKTKELQCSLR